MNIAINGFQPIGPMTIFIIQAIRNRFGYGVFIHIREYNFGRCIEFSIDDGPVVDVGPNPCIDRLVKQIGVYPRRYGRQPCPKLRLSC